MVGMKKTMEVKPKIETFARIKVLGVGGIGFRPFL
jgi:hypothetical protein